MQFFTYKVMSENSGLTHAKDCDACSQWKDGPLHNFFTYMDVFAWKYFIEARVCIKLVTQFPMLYSTDMFPRSVLTTRRVRVHVRTLRDGCVHTFLTYKVMYMRNFKHITPFLSHNFPQVHSKQSTTSRLFNLWTFLTMQLLTYKYVSVCKLSHMKLIDRGVRPFSFPSLSPRVGVGVWVRVGVWVVGKCRARGRGRVRVSLSRVGTRGFLGRRGLDRMRKYCVVIGSRPS